ncbi:MAG: TetR/AcrR family transcriptional regulator [Sphingobium sp.]|uniref:TetR/AcrR family transcriptional regulator n=1 Tax=Sphingobium sp. TaxID=1912891 RepID=UPI002E20CFB1
MKDLSTTERGRDRPRTQDAIVAAAKRLLADHGFEKWGVNAIARSAGCDKQLVYRYFGGLDGLAEAIGRDVAADLESALSAKAVPTPDSYAALVASLLDAFIDVLRDSLLMQRIIAWELSAANPLTLGFAKARGDALARWIGRIKGDLSPPPGIDAPAFNAILIAAIQHLTLSATASAGFAGISLQSEAEWQRVRAAIRHLVSTVFKSA